MSKLTTILFALLLLLCGCEEEKQDECDAICEIQKAEFERSTTGVSFHTRYKWVSTSVTVTKTSTGAIAKYYFSGSLRDIGTSKNIELDVEEWQDFISALFKCNINEWKRKYDDLPPKKTCDVCSGPPQRSTTGWELYIYSSNDEYSKIYDGPKISSYRGYEVYPSNWDEFKKVMDNMVAKIKERAGK